MKLILFLENGVTGEIYHTLLSDSIQVESRVNDKEKHEVIPYN